MARAAGPGTAYRFGVAILLSTGAAIEANFTNGLFMLSPVHSLLAGSRPRETRLPWIAHNQSRRSSAFVDRGPIVRHTARPILFPPACKLHGTCTGWLAQNATE